MRGKVGYGKLPTADPEEAAETMPDDERAEPAPGGKAKKPVGNRAALLAILARKRRGFLGAAKA